MRLFSVEPAARQQKVHRYMVGDALWQLDAGGIGNRSRPDLWQGKGGVGRAQDQVRRQGELQPPTAADALHRSDDRLVEVRQLLQAREAPNTIVPVDSIPVRRGLQIPAGAKEFLSRRADDADPQRWVIPEVPEGKTHDPAGCQTDRIGLRHVQRDLKDCTFTPGLYRASCPHLHHVTLSRISTSTATAPASRRISGLISISSILSSACKPA